MKQEPSINVILSHDGPGYLDEFLPIHIDITNHESSALTCVGESELKFPVGGHIQHVTSLCTSPQEFAESHLPSVPLGTIQPGQTHRFTLYARCSGASGDRVLHVLIHCQSETEDYGLKSVQHRLSFVKPFEMVGNITTDHHIPFMIDSVCPLLSSPNSASQTDHHVANVKVKSIASHPLAIQLQSWELPSTLVIPSHTLNHLAKYFLI
jgi:hypothetical protein